MIYFIQAGENGPIKIGQSDDPEERLKQLQTANPYELKLLWVFNEVDSYWDESTIHHQFKHELIRGEWFRPSKKIFDFIITDLKNFYTVRFSNNSHFIKVFEEYPNAISILGDGFLFSKEGNVIDCQVDGPDTRKAE